MIPPGDAYNLSCCSGIREKYVLLSFPSFFWQPGKGK